jgi:hypothetical protein
MGGFLSFVRRRGKPARMLAGRTAAASLVTMPRDGNRHCQGMRRSIRHGVSSVRRGLERLGPASTVVAWRHRMAAGLTPERDEFDFSHNAGVVRGSMRARPASG